MIVGDRLSCGAKTMTRKKVGLIGLGLLGSAMAERFLNAGFDVVGFDIARSRNQDLACSGGRAVDSADEVVATCNRVVLSLPTSVEVADVLDEVANPLRSGLIIVDTTTGDPEQVAGFGERLAKIGIDYLDATVGGSSKQVLAGDVIVMVGGMPSVFEECRDILDSFARQSFYVGPCGSGARMKLALNLVLGLNRAVLAEGLGFARKFGLDPSATLDILKAGPTYSRVMDTKGQKMLERDFSTEARLSQHLKDVRLILSAGADCGAAMPFSLVHQNLLERLEADGLGDEDNSAIYQAFD